MDQNTGGDSASGAERHGPQYHAERQCLHHHVTGQHRNQPATIGMSRQPVYDSKTDECRAMCLRDCRNHRRHGDADRSIETRRYHEKHGAKEPCEYRRRAEKKFHNRCFKLKALARTYNKRVLKF